MFHDRTQNSGGRDSKIQSRNVVRLPLKNGGGVRVGSVGVAPENIAPLRCLTDAKAVNLGRPAQRDLMLPDPLIMDEEG